MANMTKQDGVWVYNSSDSSSHTLSTSNKYLDGNVRIDGAGALTAGSGSVNLTQGNVTFFSDSTNNGIYVNATGSGSVNCGTGWISSQTKSSDTATTNNKYLSGVTLTKPATGQNQFSITVPNGDGQITFKFSVDPSGNVVVTEE